MLSWLRKKAPAPPATNEAWLAALTGSAAERDRALAALRPILVRGLRAALRPKVGLRAGPLAEDVAQDALLLILDRLETFRGEARFTTWAQKVAVRLALSELRRKRWRDTSLDDLIEAGGTPSPAPAPGPDVSTSERQLMAAVEAAIEEDLTERQRTALVAVAVHEMPIEVVAEKMGTNRNALYKLLHDARKKLKASLEARGYTPSDLLP